MYTKYPRTYHLPWSPGGSRDDKYMDDVSQLLNVPVVITEKMDGGNVCLERNNCFARSHGQPPTHRSYDAFKGLHARVKHLIGEDIQVFGEWLFAKHSIHYHDLPSYLMLMGIRNKKTGLWLPWDRVSAAASMFSVCHSGITSVPELERGTYRTEAHLKSATNKLATASSPFGEREGIVVRPVGGFADEDFPQCVGKWVRENHVDDNGKHWKHKTIVKNNLAK